MCDKHKKFLARINAGQKLYCMQCQAKITKEHDQGYWKPCSFQEFLEASCLSMEKKAAGSVNMLTGLKKQFRQIKDEDADNKKD